MACCGNGRRRASPFWWWRSCLLRRSSQLDRVAVLAILREPLSKRFAGASVFDLNKRLSKGSCEMARREILDRIQKYVDPFRIPKGKAFRLKGFDPGDTCGLQLGKGEAAELLARGTQ